MEIDNNDSKIQPNEDDEVGDEKSLPSKRKSKQVFESGKKKNSKKKK